MTDEEKRVVDTLKHCAAIKECMSCIGDPRANGEIMEPSMFSMPPKCLIKTMNEAADLIERLIAELKELRDAQGDQPKAELETAKSSRWISVKDSLPDEHDSIYAKLIGTDDWMHGMWEKESDTVIVSYAWNGEKRVDVARTHDGDWYTKLCISSEKVTHWIPMPNPPKEG